MVITENAVFSVARYYMAYVNPFIIFSGVVGNVLTLVVLPTIRNKVHSATVTYLLCLAVSDLLVLFSSSIPEWYGIHLPAVIDHDSDSSSTFPRLNILTISDAACKNLFYIYDASSTISAWILVIFAVERCIAIWFPLNVSTLVTKRRRYVAVFFVICLACLTRFPSFLYAAVHSPVGINVTICSIKPSNLAPGMFQLYSILQYMLHTTIPWAAICTNSALVLARIRSPYGHLRSASAVNIKRDRKCLLNLMAVNGAFIILLGPQTIIGTLYTCSRSQSSDLSFIPAGFTSHLTHLFELSVLAKNIAAVNHSINNVIYTYNIKQYREGLKRIFCCRRNDDSSARYLNRRSAISARRSSETDL
ncbi:galanin receptor type 1-like [Tubulanus polymorphus]|uniref:galanin receptor type 1-like n=1 Tax=Tubulanus polymorphus TaxID=672921 RepID=UPI003DA25C1B